MDRWEKPCREVIMTSSSSSSSSSSGGGAHGKGKGKGVGGIGMGMLGLALGHRKWCPVHEAEEKVVVGGYGREFPFFLLLSFTLWDERELMSLVSLDPGLNRVRQGVVSYYGPLPPARDDQRLHGVGQALRMGREVPRQI